MRHIIQLEERLQWLSLVFNVVKIAKEKTALQMTPYYVLQERSAIGVGNLLHASHDTHAKTFPVERRILKFYISSFLWFTQKYIDLDSHKNTYLVGTLIDLKH